MAGLSFNWKKLQAQLQAEQSTGSCPSKSVKRKRDHSLDKAVLKKAGLKQLKALPVNEKKTLLPPAKARMGAVQSSKIEPEPRIGLSPSMSLWAEDNNISAEAIADAYGLGLSPGFVQLTSKDDKVNAGITEGAHIGKYVALDCEMVGVGPGGHESALARVSAVDFHGKQVYDSYVKPRERVTDWRTHVSGISSKEMLFARDFVKVQREIAALLKDRILVGHDIKHDLDALKLSHPLRDVRDTVRHRAYRQMGNSRKPGLRMLVMQVLKLDMQNGAHSSVEDARATMLLFRSDKPAFDVAHASKYAPTPAKKQSASCIAKGGKGAKGR